MIAVSPVLRERLMFLRQEETLRFAWSEDFSHVDVIRSWKGQPTYQLAGPVAELERILDAVLPRSRFRDERGLEP